MDKVFPVADKKVHFFRVTSAILFFAEGRRVFTCLSHLSL